MGFDSPLPKIHLLAQLLFSKDSDAGAKSLAA
jgi:hypothetical protein